VQVGFLEVQDRFLACPSPDGWRRLKQLRLREVDPDSAFVAMRFTDDLRDVFAEGIEPALLSTGFRSIRVDLIEHNGKIDDRIVADIRKSLLVVADFTGHRQNVYFEAGFALGLGRHVIWTCRDSDIGQAHFDTRQYNHVVWCDAADLRERLRNRIEATIPRARTAGDTGSLP
jgi:nucleoside 2-deoxyribosyltransferase